MTHLLIDTSYTIFYRFFATKIWYNLAHPEDKFEDNYNWFENVIFRKSFEKNYLKGFNKIIKKYNIEKKNIIFARDCPRDEIWRMKIYKNYKANRTGTYGEKEGQINIGPFFKFTYSNILPKFCENYGSKILKQDKLEADDIIALSKKCIIKSKPDSKFIIITSDHDLFQLIDKNTILVNLKNKELNKKSFGKAEIDLMVKILCGDASDNIKGCFKRCGNKTALKLINDKELLEKKFLKNIGSKEIFEINQKIIDFRNIPKELVDIFIKNF